MKITLKKVLDHTPDKLIGLAIVFYPIIWICIMIGYKNRRS